MLRLASHRDSHRGIPAGRDGTLAKARGAVDCEKGTNGVLYSTVTLLPETAEGWSGLVRAGEGAEAGVWECLSAAVPGPSCPPGGEIISCQNHSQIIGNCSSPNYLVLIGD